jgi:hypothetical protein
MTVRGGRALRYAFRLLDPDEALAVEVKGFAEPAVDPRGTTPELPVVSGRAGILGDIALAVVEEP